MRGLQKENLDREGADSGALGPPYGCDGPTACGDAYLGLGCSLCSGVLALVARPRQPNKPTCRWARRSRPPVMSLRAQA